MSAWRVVVTDTESMTGVAPWCPQQDDPKGPHGQREANDVWADGSGVYDCCPHPHIETWGEATAQQVVELLSVAGAGLCS